VIDDAIVVLENIYRFVEEKGMPPFQAAIEGTKEIGLAVMATTLSLLAVFIPVGFMQGIVGRFMSSFGLTSSFAVAVSLIVSFTLTPMLAARLIKRKEALEGPGAASVPSEGDAPVTLADESRVLAGEPSKETAARETAHEEETAAPPQEAVAREKGLTPHEGREERSSKESRFYRPIDRTYTRMLHWAMAHRWAVVLMCLLVIISIVPLFRFVGKNFLPVDDQSQFEVSVRAPEGSTLAATSALVEKIAGDIRAGVPGVTDTLVTIGGGQQEQVNVASIYVKLAPISERKQSQDDLMIEARNILGKYPQDLRTSVQQVAAISGGGFRNADIQYVIGGPDLQKLTEYSERLMEKMKTIKDVVDVDSTLINGKPEVQVQIDRARAADMGVRVGDIAQALNVLVAGQDVSTFNVGTDQYDVRVRAVGAARTSPQALENLFVQSSKSGWTNLSNFVRVEEGTGPSAIERLNRQRQVTLLANVRPGGSQAAVIEELNKYAAELNIDPSYSTGLAGRSK
jgi:HAE1 family hydrophobic/amphiphilic exporter-1